MPKRKSIQEFDRQIKEAQDRVARLMAGKKEALLAMQGPIGEAAMISLPGIPEDKDEMRAYFANVAKLIAAHQTEFDMMFRVSPKDMPVLSAESAATDAVSDDMEKEVHEAE